MKRTTRYTYLLGDSRREAARLRAQSRLWDPTAEALFDRLGVGPGSDVNAPLAVAVIGGMVSSTLLTLIVVPSVYSLVEHRLARR